MVAGNTYQLPITYESQLDDSGKHIVAVGGIRTGDLYGVKSGITEGIKKNKTTNSEAAPQPQTVPTASSAASSGSKQYKYMQHVTLTGMLKSAQGVDANEKNVTYPSLQLTAPITVNGNPNDDDEFLRITETNVSGIQLVLNDELMSRYRSMKGKNVTVSCSDLFHEFTGHHFTKVLCTATEIR